MSPEKFSVGAAILAAIFLLAGCADATYPFQPEQKPLPRAVAAFRTRPDVIAVAPVSGLGDPLSRDLARAMATALEKRDLPVALEDDPDWRTLYAVSGRYDSRTTGPGNPPAVVWEVRDAQGTLVARYRQVLPLDSDPAAPGMRIKLLADAGNEAAREIVKGIEGDAPPPVDVLAGDDATVTIQSPLGHSLVVAAIEGAPLKSGDTALRQAIEYALKVVKVNVVKAPATDTLVLKAKVEFTPLTKDLEHVQVVWTVLDADGKELGQVTQQNNVPTRLIDQVWSEISSAVAQNAADGIAAIVAQANTPKKGG